MPPRTLSTFVLVLAGGCFAEQLEMPGVAAQWRSPNGRYVAEVRNHFSVDPPEQSLWIGAVGGEMYRIQTVASDTDPSVERVAWSGDSALAVYVDALAEIVVVDAGSGRTLARHAIVARNAGEAVRALELDPRGAHASFRVCRDGLRRCSESRRIPLTTDVAGR